MMQGMWVPLRNKLLNFNSSGIIPKIRSQLWNSSNIRHIHSNYYRIQQSKLFIPCTSTCDLRSFHSSHNHLASPPSRLVTKNSSIFPQNQSPNHHTFPSKDFHKSIVDNFNLFQRSSITSSVSILNFESFNKELSTNGQLRFLHGHSSRRRVNRTFSSRNNSNQSPDGEGKELKDGKDGEKDEDADQKLTVYQRFKKTYKEHGKVLVVVHLMTSAVWFGTFYTAARCGVDVVPLLESWNLSEKVIAPFRSGGLGDVALAYLMYKLVTPARYTVTLGGTNLAVRYLKREGRMQQVPKEDSLRELYKDGKEDLKSKGKNTRHRLRHMRHRLQGRIRRVRKRHLHDRKDH